MSNRKYILIGVLIFVVILGPVLTLSNLGLGMVQRIIDKNPKGSSAPWFQYTIAKIYYVTARPERAADTFNIYIERYAENKDQRYWNARYYRCYALDDANRTQEAAEAFRDYYETCPTNDPNRPDVKMACVRYRHRLGGWTPPD
jgi:tetratricopeptide (TPR) repeat protein